MSHADARRKALDLIARASLDQLDEIREYDETRENCRARMFRLAHICPFTALTLMEG